MLIAAKIVGLFGIALNIWGAVIIDRGTVHGAQMGGWMDDKILAEMKFHNDRREKLRKNGWKLMLLGFAAQGVSILIG